jgi:signal peptidase II
VSAWRRVAACGVGLGLVLAAPSVTRRTACCICPGVARGHVVDFVDFHIWPVFNVADSCVVIGVFIVVIAGFFHREPEREAEADA